MATNLFKLVGSVFVDTDKANESLSKTDQKAEGVGSKLATAGKVAAGFAGAAVAATATVVKGMKEQADATAAACDEIDKGSQRMNVSAETYQQLSHAADLSGVSMSTMENAAKKLQSSGSNLDLTAALKQVASIKDESERSAKAVELFGSKAAYDLAPMLNAGADGIQGMMDEATKLGLVMSGDAVSAGASYQDTMSKLEDTFGALKNTLGAEFMPVFETVANIMLDNMPQIQSIVAELAPILGDMIQQIVPMAMEILPMIISLLPTIVDLAKAVVPPILEVAQIVIPYLIQVLDTFLPVLKNIIDFVSNVFAGNWGAAWENIVNIFTGIWETMKAIFIKPINWIIDKLNQFIDFVNGIKIPEGIPIVGGIGLNFEHIPHLKVGIDYVPNDDYPALLHRGEQVLTAEEAFEYKQQRGVGNARVESLLEDLVTMFRTGRAKTGSTIENSRELRAQT